VPHERWGETVKAIVVPRAGAEVDQDDVIGFVRKRLAGFKCPTSVDFVAALPRTATGKVLKHVLREPYWHGYDRRIN
jgi:acyl-CoA synthetase (AMP-forming)/AMP-acid ligase II